MLFHPLHVQLRWRLGFEKVDGLAKERVIVLVSSQHMAAPMVE